MITVIDLDYTREDFMDILRSVTPIQDDATKMGLDPFPSIADLVTFAGKAYCDFDYELRNGLPEGWKLLTTARYGLPQGYFGCVYWNPSQQQVVLAHRGTDLFNLGAVYADIKGIWLNRYTNLMFSAVTLGDDIKRAILELNKRDGVSFTLTITGHSLGGWLAQITALTLKYLKRKDNGFVVESNTDEGIHAHTVVFDSPGVQEMVKKIQQDSTGRYDLPWFLSLDISNFFMAVNSVNATGFHAGSMYQVPSDLVCTSGFKHFFSNFSTHGIKNYTDAFGKGNVKLFQVKDWPQGWWRERRLVHKLEKAQESHFPEPEAGHYNLEEDMGTSIRLYHFSEVELDLVNLIIVVRQNEIRESQFKTVFEQLLKQYFQGLSPNFQTENRKDKTVTLESELHLKKFVKNIKNALRWFSRELQDVKKLQEELTAPRILLEISSKENQDSIPALPDCEDTLGLCEFTRNTAHILYIQTADCSLEMARIFNILYKDYPYIDHCVFLNCESLLKLNKNLTPLENDRLNLFIINIGSAPETLPVHKVLENIFSKFKEFSKKKAVIVSHKNSVLFDFVKSFESELAIHCVPLSAQECLEFKIKDLKDSSRRELFSKEFIILGEQAMSLNTLLGENCQSSVSIDDVLKPFLKEILMNESFTLNIPNNLSKFVQLDVMFLKINREVAPASLSELLREETYSLFMSSDDRQLIEPQLQEVAGAAERMLGVSGSSEEDFHQACLENSSIQIAYWLAVTDGRVYLKQIYNHSFYLRRQFHHQSVVDFKKLVQKINNADQFVFVGVTNKATLMRYLKASPEVEQLFSTNLKFKIQESAENAEGIDRCVNKHTLEVVKEGGGYLLVWQDSQGALDSLFPCVSTDSRLLSESEEDLCTRKAVIISDLPGMGKSTTITSLSRHLVNSWVLRMNLRDRRADITNLRAQMSVESVANFLLGTDSELATLSLLQFCLQSKGSRQIHVLLDGFDEIRDEDAVKKILKLCHFLKNETTAKIIVTTRESYKHVLINGLATVATIFEEITDDIQLSFLVNFWNSHAVLGQKDERLRLFAQHLYEAAHKKLGDDTIRLIGIPLHMRMLAEAFLQQAEQFSRNTESIPNIIGMNNVYDLFKKFISVKRDIYLKEKISLAYNMADSLGDILCETLTVNHCVLAFEILDPEFKKKYLPTDKMYEHEMNRFGLTQWNRETNCDFIHRTFAEYFCSQLLVLWLRRENFCYKHLPIEEWFLGKLLTNKDSKVVRKFLDEHLVEVTFAEESKQILYNNMSKCWSTNAEAFRDEKGQTALHVAVKEENTNIIKLLLGGLVMEQTREPFESFLLARDYDNNTALKTGINILRNIKKLRDGFLINFPIAKGLKLMLTHLSYDLKFKLLLYTVLEDPKCSEFLIKCPLNEKEQEDIQSALKRITALRKEVLSGENTFIENFILNDQNNITERKFLLLAQINGETVINRKSLEGNYELVDQFIQINRECVNSRDYDRMTPLHNAVKGGHINLVKLLHQHGARLNDHDIFGSTILFYAAESGNQDVIKYLILDHGAQSKLFNESGESLLHVAIVRNNLETIKYLISSKENIDQKDKNGKTPLIKALSFGNWEIAKYLLESEADSNISDCNDKTPLMYAVEKKKSFLSCNMTDQAQKLLWPDIVNKIISGSKDITTDINKSDHLGKTFLHYAALGGDIEIVKNLISKVDNVNCLDNVGKTPLHYAVETGHTAIVEYLISEVKVNVNCRDNGGKTPLHHAILGRDIEIIKNLISKVDNVNCLDNDGKTPLHYAVETGHVIILENGKPIVEKGRMAIVEYLISEGNVDIDCLDNSGKTPLHYAIIERKTCHWNVIDPSITNCMKETDLMVAEYLLKSGANRDIRDYDGKTPLDYATKEFMDKYRKTPSADPIT